MYYNKQVKEKRYYKLLIYLVWAKKRKRKRILINYKISFSLAQLGIIFKHEKQARPRIYLWDLKVKKTKGGEETWPERSKDRRVQTGQ